jgi:predicted Zn-ribbon and HTH transcriptional regulator
MKDYSNYTKCLQCGYEFELNGYSIDELGYYTSCPLCKGSFDIDLEEYI